MADSNKMKGTVKWFSAKRGYGFITDEDGIDYFVHFSEIQSEGFKTLRGGEQVLFSVTEDEKGRSLAKQVVPAGIPEESTED
nr:cold shock domain-containing protein [Mediterraneibacter glycyrrhizinilyticus]